MRLIKEVTIQLTEDLHGFPTFAIRYQSTRYNFCHLKDVNSFITKVFTVDNDKLLKGQPTVDIAKPPYKELHESILIMVELGLTAKEITNEAHINFPSKFTNRQIWNTITWLLRSGQIKPVKKGLYEKVGGNTIPRKLHDTIALDAVRKGEG